MENEILREILIEIKRLRGESVVTNERLDSTNVRLDTTINRLDGLHDSVVVLQQGVNDVRYELQNIKEILSDKVIWQNDNISIETREGKVIYDVINKMQKK